jgi:hypothetical protein
MADSPLSTSRRLLRHFTPGGRPRGGLAGEEEVPHCYFAGPWLAGRRPRFSYPPILVRDVFYNQLC